MSRTQPNSVFDNIVLLSDSYKVSHYKQYPKGTTTVYSYFESRGGKFDSVCFFGLQYFIKRYLCGQVVTQEKIDEAYDIYKDHFGDASGPKPEMFYKEGWEYILNTHGGKLPVVIKSVPEGTVVPNRNVLFTMENTDPKCFWLTNFLETLLVEVWYPMTVCTQSREQKKIIAKYLRDTGPETTTPLEFKLHDFGFRGVSSVESAAIGGCAHLVNFLGTDTVAALIMAKNYYGAGTSGFSIPASEHSTITSWGESGEKDAFKNMLEQYPTGLVACVSDSFNIWNACENLWGTELKDQILSRDGVLVIRPDSGEPKEIVVKCLEILCKQFGSKETANGYKVIDANVRLIQGDGISIESLPVILDAMKDAGYSADNVAFGSGGALLQKLNRDTMKCAFKCSEISISDGQDGTVARNVYKDPITDKGKASKKGRLTLERNADGVLETKTEGTGCPEQDILVEVFRDGACIKEWTFDEIKARAALSETDY